MVKFMIFFNTLKKIGEPGDKAIVETIDNNINNMVEPSIKLFSIIIYMCMCGLGNNVCKLY